MTTVKTFPLSYAHCTKYTTGQLDREPHSAYETRSVNVTLWRISGNPDGMGIDEDTFHVRDESGNVIGCDFSKEDAIHDALYRLMADSRKQAQQH